jgi:Ner family transcriptional regulator
MDSIDINYKLKKIGITQASLARELGISTGVVNNVIHGKVTAYSIAQHIAKLIGHEVNEVWPNLYVFKPRGASKRRNKSSELLIESDAVEK